MLIIKCPECDNEIDHLRYNEPSTTYGIYTFPTDINEPENIIRNGNYDSDETDSNGDDTTWSCPECDNEIEMRENLIIEFEDGQKMSIRTWQEQERNLPENEAQIKNTRKKRQLTEEEQEMRAEIILSRPTLIDQGQRGQMARLATKYVKCPKDNTIILVETDKYVECTQCGLEIEVPD